MNFIKKIIKKITLLKQYFSFYADIKSLLDELNEAGIVLFLLKPKDLSIIAQNDSSDFSEALLSDAKFKDMIGSIVLSLSNTHTISHVCIHIHKKYYNLSIRCVYKKVFFTHRINYIICVATDITNQVNMHHITYHAYNEQLRINKMKTAFLSRMSHEFRTPLNAVIGFSDAIKHKLYGDIPTPYLEYIDNIHMAGNHLLDIVNDIMDVSFHENNECLLHISTFSPIQAIHTILQFIHCLLAKQKITVNLSHDFPDDFMIHNDVNVFKRIFINIIGNVCKYCPKNTSLDIKLYYLNNILLVDIHDYGDGFPQTVIDNFGIPFNVSNNFLTDTHHSIGLGLSIIKNSVQAMGGIAKIYNHTQGGAVVCLQIPISVQQDIIPPDFGHLPQKAA